MKNGFIETENYKKFIEVIGDLKEQKEESFKSAKMALFSGGFGIGKTWAIEKMAGEEEKNIIFLRVEEVWTKSYLIRKIGAEVNAGSGKVTDINEEIKNKLLTEEKGRIIVVDEVDKLLTGSKHELLEVFRDLSDQTGCMIIFIGMEKSAISWAKYGHYYSRLRLCKLEKTTTGDVEKFCELSEVKIEKDLSTHFYNKYGNLRQIKRQIEALEVFALKNDLDSIDLKTYNEIEKSNGKKSI